MHRYKKRIKVLCSYVKDYMGKMQLSNTAIEGSIFLSISILVLEHFSHFFHIKAAKLSQVVIYPTYKVIIDLHLPLPAPLKTVWKHAYFKVEKS